MISARLARMRRRIEAPFPERHIYIRAAGEVRGVVLTTGQQLLLAVAALGVIVWITLATLGMAVAGVAAYASNEQARRAEAANAHQLARHDARLIAAVDTLARTGADHLRTTLNLAGVNPDSVAPAMAGGQGGPLIDPRDPRAVDALRGLGAGTAGPIVTAARDVAKMRILANASSALPLARPTADMGQSSGFGIRRDPITGHAAFHPGLDFPRPRMTPVFATAPGVVSFAGARNGYGDTVEITHDRGFVTRFAHLAAITVGVGQKVVSHQRIGAIGSTGRSTGPHLHYEVLRDGRPLDPQRFLKAGDYVQQVG
jgi:murein DD-endopeptidase MepM/ murein hydrolase activator NlpD